MSGLFDLPGLSGFIVMCLAQHNILIVHLSECGQPCNWIRRCSFVRVHSTMIFQELAIINCLEV